MSYHESRTSGAKECSDCHRKLPVIFFAASPGNRDGLMGRCRECASAVEDNWPSRKRRKSVAAARRVRKLRLSESAAEAAIASESGRI